MTENVYFGGKLIRGEGAAVVQGRLGSVVWREGVGGRDYFPYGDEMGTASAGNVGKFGTYLRDQTTGLDYADQRYFTGLQGRFLSSDPHEASGGASEPSSWNRYPYVGGDPVNFLDRSGLVSCPAGSTTCIDVNEPGLPICYVMGSPVYAQEMCNLAGKMPGTYNDNDLFAPEGGSLDVQGIKWRNLKEGKNDKQVVDVIKHIRESLRDSDPDCFSFMFGSTPAGSAFGGSSSMLGQVALAGVNAESMGVVVGDSAYLAQANTGGNLRVGGTNALIFLSNTLLSGGGPEVMLGSGTNSYALAPGSAASTTFALLHEMAHMYRATGFQSRDSRAVPGGAARQDANNALLWEKCSKTIRQ